MKRFCLGLLSIAACAGILTYSSCTHVNVVADGTSETTNGFTASVRDSNGNPVARALVRIRPQDYLPDTNSLVVKYNRTLVIDTLTDSSGKISIGNINVGPYTVEVFDGKGLGVLMRGSAAPDSFSDWGAFVVSAVGSISGTVDRASLGSNAAVYALVRDLQRIAKIDAQTGAFTLHDLPMGKYSLHFIVSLASLPAQDLDSVAVVSGKVNNLGILHLGYSGQISFSREIALNTTPSGANVPGNVVNFPVLVRLNKDNFDFSRTSGNGAGIQFTKADNTVLPFEIERWDSLHGLAELWVKVDTVFGNNNSQSISIHYGLSPALTGSTTSTSSMTEGSNGPAVFDTANGFQAVWHLSEAASVKALDATANRFDGSPSANAPTVLNGMVGSAKSFNGQSNFFQITGTESGKLNFPENGNYSVSAWVYTDTINSLGQSIVNKSNFDYGLQMHLNRTWDFYEMVNSVGWVGAQAPVTVKTWFHLTGVRSGNSHSLYVNGDLVATGTDTTLSAIQRSETYPVFIGRLSEGGRFFSGVIDEVRLSNVALSADWIKLCFMNQRSDDKLVTIK